MVMITILQGWRTSCLVVLVVKGLAAPPPPGGGVDYAAYLSSCSEELPANEMLN